MRAMRCASPPPAASRSPPWSPPRSWSGRCMRAWPRSRRNQIQPEQSVAALTAAALARGVFTRAAPGAADGSPVDGAHDERRRLRRRPSRPGRPPSPWRFRPTWPRRPSTRHGRPWCRQAGRCRCGPGCREPGWRPGHPTGHSWCRCRPPVRSSRSHRSPAARPSPGSCSRGSPAARPGVRRLTRSTSPRATGSMPTPTPRGAATDRRTVAPDLPDAKSPDLRRRLCARAQECCSGTRWGGVLLDRLHRQHLRRGSHRDTAARDDHAGSARRRAGRAVRDRRTQRHRAGHRPGRLGVDRGEQPRQRRRGPRTAESTPTTSTSIRPSPWPG